MQNKRQAEGSRTHPDFEKKSSSSALPNEFHEVGYGTSICPGLRAGLRSGSLYLAGLLPELNHLVADQLHKWFGWQIIDVNAEIETETGMPLASLLEMYGEASLSRQQTAVIYRAAAGERQVVICDADMVLNEHNIGLMKRSGSLVWLDACACVIASSLDSRLFSSQARNDQLLEAAADLKAQYDPQCIEKADLIIETKGKSAQEICFEIARKCSLLDS